MVRGEKSDRDLVEKIALDRARALESLEDNIAMTNKHQHPSSNSRPPLSLPGQNLEDAAVEVGTEAGKSVVRGIGRLVGAAAAKWVATKEAEAEAAALAIKMQAETQRDRALTQERRETELEEIEHQAKLGRRLARLRYELAREQANFESIAVRSLELIEGNPKADKGRDIDEDWIFAFARFAQAVSDKDVQELWARILSSAAMAEGQKVSAAALQTMSLLDKKGAADFRKICAAHATFIFYPAHDRCCEPDAETQNIDLMSLTELGLIREGTLGDDYSFVDFWMSFGTTTSMRLLRPAFPLTRRGSEIANAVFRENADLKLSGELEQKYLQEVTSNLINRYHSASITPAFKQGELVSPNAILLTHPRGPAAVKSDISGIAQKFSERLERFVEWAATRYDITPTTMYPWQAL